jgi:phosphoglycerate dehydrogenase-like enzyme
VVLSPHVGGWTEQSYIKIAEVLLQKIKQLTLC